MKFFKADTFHAESNTFGVNAADHHMAVKDIAAFQTALNALPAEENNLSSINIYDAQNQKCQC